MTNLLVENISLPKEVEAALDKRSSMGIVGNLDQYTQFQAAEALRDAAANPGGGSEAMSMGLGLAMAQRLNDALARPTQSAPAPPPLPTVNPVSYTHLWLVTVASQSCECAIVIRDT